MGVCKDATHMCLDVSRETLICTVKMEVGNACRSSLHDRPVAPVPAIDTSMQGILTIVIVRWNVIYIRAVWLGVLSYRD